MYSFLSSNRIRTTGLILGIIVLIVAMVASVILGVTEVTIQSALDAYLNFDNSNQHIIIRTVRLPRALIAAAVGASLAIAGALMQALTRNPLASPAIFGVNAGAGFFIVIAVSFFSVSITELTWFAFLGAGINSLAVYILGSSGREGLTPLKLTLSGAALTALFSSLTQGLLVVNEKTLDEVLFWLTGSVAGRELEVLQIIFPYLLIGWLGSFVMAKALDTLTMGEDIAKGLGQRILIVKILVALIVILLAGGSVAIAGPIGFIGIIIPHIARSLVGRDFRWLIPYCALLGAILLVLADISARFIIMPQEIPVGVMTAFIGTPFFVYIARRGFNK